MTRFVYGMIRREIRSGRRHFIFILSAVALGVGSIVGVEQIAGAIEKTISREARSLLTADLEARLTAAWPASDAQDLNFWSERGGAFLRVTETITMAVREDRSDSQLVELKAVDPAYPFYGALTLDPPDPKPFLDSEAAWVQEPLLIRLNLRVGDTLMLGRARFTVRGVIQKEPDRVVGTFSLGPRVLISQKGLARADLIQPGSRVTYRLLFRLPESLGLDEGKSELAAALGGDNQTRIRTYQEAQPRLARFLENLTTYLGLVGLITLLIGGIIVANHIHALLNERIETIAILRSLGASPRTLISIYLLLALGLGSLGSLIGVGLGFGLGPILKTLLSEFLPSDLSLQPMIQPALRGLGLGFLTTLLFSLRPLWQLQKIPPSRVFRKHLDPPAGARMDPVGWLMAAVLISGGAALAVWQAGSWTLGGWVAGAVIASALLLSSVWWILLRLTRPWSKPRPLALRYGIGNLYRPGREVGTIVLSVGIGLLILLTLAQVEGRLTDQLRDNIPSDAPGLFFIDLQPDQREAFETLLGAWTLNKPPELTPIVRGRIDRINGTRISERTLENRPDAWYFTREYVLTFQNSLPEHNRIRAGEWWPDDYGTDPRRDPPLLSVEEEAARHLGLGIGDEITLDIQGLLQTARVSSLREVDWNSLSTNFFMIFSPGVLEKAPLTYVATAITRPEDDFPIQNAVLRAFPNVTVIHLREVLETASRIIQRIGGAVRFMALLGLIAGMIVLSGAISASRVRRIREMVLLKTLGATRPILIGIMAVEYGLLGLVASGMAGILSVGVSWGIVRFFLEVPWRFDPKILILGSAATVALTILTGFLTSWRIVGEKPLKVLRTE